MGHCKRQTGIFEKPGAERLAASRGAGRAGEVLSGCGCEQVAKTMHSNLKKAGGLKKLLRGLFIE